MKPYIDNSKGLPELEMMGYNSTIHLELEHYLKRLRSLHYHRIFVSTPSKIGMSEFGLKMNEFLNGGKEKMLNNKVPNQELVKGVLDLVFKEYETKIEKLEEKLGNRFNEILELKQRIAELEIDKVEAAEPEPKPKPSPKKTKDKNVRESQNKYIKDHYQGMKAKDIARDLGLSIKAVQKRVSKLGLKKKKEPIKPYKENPLANPEV